MQFKGRQRGRERGRKTHTQKPELETDREKREWEIQMRRERMENRKSRGR